MLDKAAVASAQPGATAILRDFVASGSTPPPAAMEAARMALLDWLGCAIAGARTTQGLAAARLATNEAGRGHSTLFPDGSRISATWAAFANAAGSYSIEFDDVHMPSIMHGGVTVIPAALAVAEEIGASGARFLDAIVTGYEIAFRIGEAVGRGHYRRFHSTGTVGTFGAAAAVARLLELSREQTEWAFGHAGSQAAGLWRYLATAADTRSLHPAKAAMNGMIAAKLAADRFIGPEATLEGEGGFFLTMADEVEIAALDGVGRHFKILENGYKRFPCCRHAHVGLDLLLALQAEQGLQDDEIEEVSITLNPVSHGVLSGPLPQTPQQAAFSMAYLAATALLKQGVDLSSFSKDSLADPQTLRLMQKVTLHSNPAFERNFPEKWTTVVEVRTMNGRRIAAMGDLPVGDADNPIPVGQLEEKFLALVAGILTASEARLLIERVRGIETMENARMLLAGLGG